MLITGPHGIRLCPDCIATALLTANAPPDITGPASGRPAGNPMTRMRGQLTGQCSFCGASPGPRQIVLIASDTATTDPVITVCTTCLNLCQEILATPP